MLPSKAENRNERKREVSPLFCEYIECTIKNLYFLKQSFEKKSYLLVHFPCVTEISEDSSNRRK